MKAIEVLQNTPHLCIDGEIDKQDFGGARAYYGWVEWDDLDFAGSVIWGYDEAGLMEHVSLCPANKKKLPSWDVMCRLKDMFFRNDEMVVQIHPAEKNYVHAVGVPGNRWENMIHLWRPMDGNWEILNRPEEWQEL